LNDGKLALAAKHGKDFYLLPYRNMSVHQPVVAPNDLADVGTPQLRNDAPRLREIPQLMYP
jgi:hypothetical protein